MAPLVRTGGSRHTGLAALPHRNIHTGTLDALRQNRSITLNTLNDICQILQCDVNKVIKFYPD